jgi:hypothetical protein
MATLQEKRVNFNSKMVINNSGGNLSTDSGLILVKEFMDSIGFSKLASQFLTFQDNRSHCFHDNISLLEQLLFQLIAGYPADSSANSLKEDPVFQLVLEKESLASQASLSRFWDRISEATISQFQTLNQALIDKVHVERDATELIIDLDSTHSDTFGKQEGSKFNAHYRTNGYHPLVAFDGLTGDFLKAELRSGNVYTSNGVKDFLEPMLAHYSQTLPCTKLLVRGDSGFATPEVYDICEAYQSQYVIRLKKNKILEKIAESFILIGNEHPWEEKEVHYHDLSGKELGEGAPDLHQIHPGSERAAIQARVCGHELLGGTVRPDDVPALPQPGDDGKFYQGSKERLLFRQDRQFLLLGEPCPHDGQPVGL